MNIITQRVEMLSSDPNYWHRHVFWLAVAWYGAGFFALLLKKKLSPSIISTIIRAALYFFAYLITLTLLASTIYRLLPIFYNFDNWPFGRRVHIMMEIIMGFVIVFHFLTGIRSIFSKQSKKVFQKLQNPIGHIYRIHIVICLIILQRYYWALGGLIVGLAQWAILRGSNLKTLQQHSA